MIAWVDKFFFIMRYPPSINIGLTFQSSYRMGRLFDAIILILCVLVPSMWLALCSI